MFEDVLGLPGDGVGRMDVAAAGDRYELLVDVPGVARDDLEVTVHGGHVVIAGTRRRSAPDSGGTAVRRFERRLALGEDLDADRVAASLADGVLRVTVPRAAERRRIPIGARAAGPARAAERLRGPWQRMRVRRGPELRRSLGRLARRAQISGRQS